MSFDALNAEQKEAVTTCYSNVLVLAGAGSGKTRTLIERVAWLIEQGASGHEIVCATFTRAAAGEMRARLEARIGESEARKVTLSTLHGLGLRLLSSYGHCIGLRRGKLTVLGPLETNILLQHEGEKLGLYSKGKWRHGKKALDAVFSQIEAGATVDPDSPYMPLVRGFVSACRACNTLPYYGLIHGLVEMIKKGLVSEFTNWKYMLVDEVQDLDPMQWNAVSAFRDYDGSEIFAVGDLSQSIYSFRGAVPQYLQSLVDGGYFHLYKLQNNYRSNAIIVQAANQLIAHNKKHTVLQMQPMHGAGEPTEAVFSMDSHNLADYISTMPREGTVAVLCRNNRMLDKISDELTALGIEHRRVGKRTTELHSPLFVKANAALKCFANPFDDVAFLLAHKGLRLTAGEYSEYCQAALENDTSAFQEFIRADAERASTLPTGETRVSEALDWFASGQYEFDPEDGESGAYLTWLRAYIDQNPLSSVSEYLDWVALADVQDELTVDDPDDAGLLLMTCHASKGLEFPTVIIAGCNDGVMPSKQALKLGEEGIEDERRLMYVAVTRAKNRLILAIRPQMPSGIYEASRAHLEPPSRFLAEMGILSE